MGFGSSSNKSNQQSTSASTSTSLNQAYPVLSSTLTPTVNNANLGSNAIASLLGLQGDTGQSQAFQNYKDSSGYNFVQDQGVRGITSSNAAKGLLGSGSTLKSVMSYSSNLAQNFLNSYLSSLSGLSGTGLQAGQVLASAGNTANSQSNSNSYGTSTGSSTNLSLK